jgi:hypothetical protein
MLSDIRRRQVTNALLQREHHGHAAAFSGRAYFSGEARAVVSELLLGGVENASHFRIEVPRSSAVVTEAGDVNIASLKPGTPM